MKQTREDLLSLISEQPMTDEEIMGALALHARDIRRDWLMQRYGLCGWTSMSFNEIAEKEYLGVGEVKGGINRAIDMLRRHIRAGLGAVDLNAPPTPETLISDLPLNRRILRRCDREDWIFLRDLEGVTEEYLLTGGHIGRKFLAALKGVCNAVGVRIVPNSIQTSDPNEPLNVILSQNSLETIKPTRAKTLLDLLPIIRGAYDAENPLWKISEQDLGRIFACLAAAGLLILTTYEPDPAPFVNMM